MEKIYRYGDIVVMVGKPHLGEAAIVARNDCGLYALEFAHPNAELHNCGGLTDDHCGYVLEDVARTVLAMLEARGN